MKNGQLWYNTITRRVERVIATGSRVCATSFHRQDLVGWPSSYLRRANSDEVQQYLNSGENHDCLAKKESRLVYV